MKHYCESYTDVISSLSSSKGGLTSLDAEKRLVEDGANKLAEAEKTPLWKRFLEQLADPMVLILIVAAIISGITSVYAGESMADVIIILIVVVINAVLGVVQENKAEKAIEALAEMSAATSKVLRDGEVVILKSENLVRGDVVMLEAGDAVPADGRIIESASMKVEEAALTGESVPVTKSTGAIELGTRRDVPLGDRRNMVYMGSTIVYGRGMAVITDTGMSTEMGKIADALAKAEDSKTPLQLKLAHLSKILTYAVLGICVFIFFFSLLKAGSYSGTVILNTFMVAVSLAVAAIPEGLAAVVTIVLSIGVTNMSKRNAIIRRLTAVETLGCAQIICSDKTGTLTQNKMTVTEYFGTDEKLLATGMALCCDAKLQGGQATGEPTECALVNYAFSLGLDKNELERNAPRVGEAPFDSERKMMSTVHKSEKSYVQFTKGAPDEILLKCSHYFENGKTYPMTYEKNRLILRQNRQMAGKALRVLALAVKNYDSLPESFGAKSIENGLTFVGLAGMIDPIRPEVKSAVRQCEQAGIRPIMITGDHKDTAVAIATELGMIADPAQAITGSDFDMITDEQYEQDIGNYSVYARVQPEHKVRIVNMWRKKGYITAMTGDGVNDAPAIKSADIGIGMGITGTDVTKNVADMVLADDNFATIVSAVEEGRRIYDNIRKSIQFLLSSNISEVISIFVATLLGFTILKPVHLLWINLITDCFPALALGMEEGEPDLMLRQPRAAKEGIFSGGVGADVIYQGVIVSVLTLLAYFLGHYIESSVWEITNSPDGMSMAFLTMSMAEIFHSFNMRSQRGSIFAMKKQNLFLWGAAVLSLILTSAVLYIPFLSEAFGFEHISLTEYAVALLLAACVVPIVEIVKGFQRLYKSRNKSSDNH